MLFDPSNERSIPHYLIICSHSTKKTIALARDKMVQRKSTSFIGNNERKSESSNESSSAKQQCVISLESQSAGDSSASQSAGSQRFTFLC